MHRSTLWLIALLMFFLTAGLQAYTSSGYQAKADAAEIAQAAGEVKLVLIGVVYDETTLKPKSNITVELVDVSTKTTTKAVSQKDGHFYFQLRSDKFYHINLRSAEGLLLASRELSTANKQQAEVMQILLTVPAAAAQNVVSN